MKIRENKVNAVDILLYSYNNNKPLYASIVVELTDAETIHPEEEERQQ